MKKVPFVRSPFNYDLEEASEQATIPASEQGESLTVQSMTEDADINTLMYRYGITGKMPENPRIPEYGDFTGVSDYRSAIHAVREAEAGFMALPANVRARFENNPQLLLEFVSNDANRPEAEALGLVKKPAQAQVAAPPPIAAPGPSPAVPEPPK